ncbi:hypothetical protein GCM10028777_05550 [Angustibacter speluncae]
MDSSVIFLVVIGLWAAILVPYWLRRREDLSTSRTADRFSAAMRVLTHRAERDDAPRERAVVPVLRSPRLEQLTAAEDDDVEPVPVPLAPSSPRPRRVRAAAGLLLLAALVAVPVLTALSFAGVLVVWAPMPAAAVVVAVVLGLRATAHRTSRVPEPVVEGVVHEPAVADVVVDDVEDDAPVDVRDELFDEDAHRRREDDARIRRLAEEAARAADVPYREPEPGEWTPVQVPLPSYLLKPHARPAWQGRAQPALPVAASAPVRAADVDEDDIPTYAPPRRAVGG